MKELEIVVVGAGIGGLQASLALAADGHRVTVLESTEAFEEVRSKFRRFHNLTGIAVQTTHFVGNLDRVSES